MSDSREFIQKLEQINTPYIENYPALSAAMPDCLFAAAESHGKFLHGMKDFTRLYGEHTFLYDYLNESYRGEPIRVIASNDLNVMLFRHEDEAYYFVEDNVIKGFMAEKMEYAYGIRATIKQYTSIAEFLDDLVSSLNKNCPVVSQFDVGFMKSRLDYQQTYAIHMLVVMGYDPEKEMVYIDDPQNQKDGVSLTDFIGCYEHLLKEYGSFEVYNFEKINEPRYQLSKELIKREIEVNLANLKAEDPRLGLNALNRFRDDMEQLRHSKEPYIIPGVWVFGRQRYSCIQWLEGILEDYNSPKLEPIISEMIDFLHPLYQRWHEIYIKSTIWVKVRRISSEVMANKIVEALEMETQSLFHWERLKTVIKEITNECSNSN